MEKTELSNLIFTFGIITFLTILTIIKLFSLNVDTTNLIILLFFIVCVAAFFRIEKHEVEKETEEVKK